jgi:hypothetical protein
MPGRACRIIGAVCADGSGLAHAQSGSAGCSIAMMKNRCPVHARANPQSPRRSQTEADEPRRASRKSGGGAGQFDGAWLVVAMNTPCGSSTERVVISGGRITGEWSSGQVGPNGALTGHGSAGGLSWTSSGRMTAHNGSGSFVRSDGCTGRWTPARQQEKRRFFADLARFN